MEGGQACRHLACVIYLHVQPFATAFPPRPTLLIHPPPARRPLPQLTGSVAFAGGLHDPVASLILCTPGYVDLSVINGEIVVRDGQLLTCDLDVSPAAAAAAAAASVPALMGGGSCRASGSCGGGCWQL